MKEETAKLKKQLRDLQAAEMKGGGGASAFKDPEYVQKVTDAHEQQSGGVSSGVQDLVKEDYLTTVKSKGARRSDSKL